MSDHRIEIKAQEKMSDRSMEILRSTPTSKFMSGVVPPFSRLANMSERHGFDVFIMGWPVREDQSDYLSQLSDRFGFTYIDMSPELATYREKGVNNNPYRVADGHPNEEGHKLIADGIMNSVNFTEFLGRE